MLTDGYLLLRNVLTERQRVFVESTTPLIPQDHQPLKTYPLDSPILEGWAKLMVESIFTCHVHRTGGTFIPRCAGERARGWHQDHRFWGQDCNGLPPAIGVMLYPGQARQELAICPGSHRRWTEIHSRIEKCDAPLYDGSSPESAIKYADAEHSAIDNVLIGASDVLLIDARVLHAVHEHDRDRRCLNVWCWLQPPSEMRRFPRREDLL